MGKETHKFTFPFSGWPSGSGWETGKSECRHGINIDFEIRRSIAKQSVKVVMLVEEWEWEPDKVPVDYFSAGMCNLILCVCVCVCVCVCAVYTQIYT